MSAHQTLISNVYLFKEMSPEELDEIQAMSSITTYAPGDEIFAEGERAVKFYRSLALFLCGRLRLTTTDLSFAREKNLRHF